MFASSRLANHLISIRAAPFTLLGSCSGSLSIINPHVQGFRESAISTCSSSPFAWLEPTASPYPGWQLLPRSCKCSPLPFMPLQCPPRHARSAPINQQLWRVNPSYPQARCNPVKGRKASSCQHCAGATCALCHCPAILHWHS